MQIQKSKPKKRKLFSFRKNTDGVAAIEFALIAPLMIAMYLGLAEVSLLITADRKVSHAASVLGDLATQMEFLTPPDVEDIFNATLATLDLTPTQANRVNIDLSSFYVDSGGFTKSAGYTQYGTGYGSFDQSNFNDTILNSTSGIMVARVRYYYSSPSTTFVKNMKLEEVFMFKPRKSSKIGMSGKYTSVVVCRRITSKGSPRTSCS